METIPQMAETIPQIPIKTLGETRQCGQPSRVTSPACNAVEHLDGIEAPPDVLSTTVSQGTQKGRY